MDTAAFEVSHYVGTDKDATALRAARTRLGSIWIGVLTDDSSRRAHIYRFVVMDIAGFKVGHSVGFDIDATALRAARARSSSIGAMERYGFDLAQ